MDKEKQEKVFDILAKMEFFQGQRAGRELWNDKPKEVQDQDIADFVRDIKYIRSYLKDSVVLTERELLDNCELQYDAGYKKALADLEKDSVVLSREEKNALWLEAWNKATEQASKETAEKFLKKFAIAFPKTKGISSSHVKINKFIDELAKQCGIEIKD